MTYYLHRLLATALLVSSWLPAQGKIDWQTSLDEALARAVAENAPIAVCISMKGERVCDVIVAEHYTDPAIVALSKHTINLFCSPSGTAAQQELEKRVRLDLLKKDADTWMIAPQHVFLTPAGKVISSVPYYLTVGELEWTWAHAVRAVDPKFAWEPSDRARAPARLQQKGAAVSREVAKPPTAKQLEAMLREIKRGYGGYYGARDQLPVIVRHPGGQARRFVQRILDAFETTPSQRVEVLRLIGLHAPRTWWTVAVPLLAADDAPVRRQAALALAQLGESRCVKALHARWKKEPSDEVRFALLHAMVACAPGDRRVLDLVPFVAEKGEREGLRVHATLAVASLENRKVVQLSLSRALTDDAGRVRSAAAYAIAVRREAGLREALAAAAESERDAEVGGFMTKALAVLDGGDLDQLEPLRQSLDRR